MASIHKDPRGKSPFFYAAFYGADGNRKFKSTKMRDRKSALAIAVRWEDAARRGRKNELTAAQARKVLAEIVEFSTGESLTHYTAASWLKEWLDVKSASATESTMTRYKQVIRDFEACLGPRATAPLPSITPGDIAKFRDSLRKGGRAPSTCNMVIKKILSVPFEDARRRGYILTNPTQGVDAIKGRGAEAQAGREPFTTTEVDKLLACADGDWKGAIICAVTTGLRLGDVARLTWDAYSEKNATLSVTTQKTGATVTVPIHPDFAAWLSGCERGIGKAFFFPTLATQRTGGCRGLSAQFRKIMERAKITGRVIEREGKGRTGFSKGFHSLRHSFVSDLANAGVAPDLRQKLAGHADERVHRGYTHHEIETFRAAIAKLPRRKAS